MAVTEGRNGLVTVNYSSDGKKTVGQLGNWSVSGISRDLIEGTAFGDRVKKFYSGMLNAGSISFAGNYDGNDTYQVAITEALSSGVEISNSTVNLLYKLRLWANSDTDFDGYGFWSCTNSSGRFIVTSMDVGQDKNGIGTISITAQVSHGALAWATST